MRADMGMNTNNPTPTIRPNPVVSKKNTFNGNTSSTSTPRSNGSNSNNNSSSSSSSNSNSKTSNGNPNLNHNPSLNPTTNYVALGPYRINRDKAVTRSTALNFLNPAEDFIGIVECLGNIRHIEKRGEMKQDLDVIDVRIIAAAETREVQEETPNGMLVRREQKQYHNEAYSLVLSKAVLLSKFRELQKEYNNTLAGLKVVIVGLGKAEDKNYYDYYVATEEKAREEGVLQLASSV